MTTTSVRSSSGSSSSGSSSSGQQQRLEHQRLEQQRQDRRLEQLRGLEQNLEQRRQAQERERRRVEEERQRRELERRRVEDERHRRELERRQAEEERRQTERQQDETRQPLWKRALTALYEAHEQAMAEAARREAAEREAREREKARVEAARRRWWDAVAHALRPLGPNEVSRVFNRMNAGSIRPEHAAVLMKHPLGLCYLERWKVWKPPTYAAYGGMPAGAAITLAWRAPRRSAGRRCLTRTVTRSREPATRSSEPARLVGCRLVPRSGQ